MSRLLQAYHICATGATQPLMGVLWCVCNPHDLLRLGLRRRRICLHIVSLSFPTFLRKLLYLLGGFLFLTLRAGLDEILKAHGFNLTENRRLGRPPSFGFIVRLWQESNLVLLQGTSSEQCLSGPGKLWEVPLKVLFTGVIEQTRMLCEDQIV
ncbi:hypothetical protein CLAFUW4_09731 [Fulvia fulva]|uniref:Uncharacterized protein n=1 Tax=Passalora fulva TaxID=5499 RepID=A0A9Q8PI36_PASFU|nr:uncharacterized protein CLAFUR5_12506 [Fulvia fulva]KAK4615504.1 hypothetical protein CLAFUR4_09736 [Fulvia fulva]KAK4617049.1 hypothetical protein CLAFUR0_09728 [Fulvia fulva]UJO23054.1 hypothetical protein CLAFUR5_12506 [Fulvia fulva]WPV19470.1 hypothetical protein CLAFUW4_09731 [Fulvia fulva]WPV34227.1 hypothetical protein CLAFUW7_09733 [Fulvia fulva]